MRKLLLLLLLVPFVELYGLLLLAQHTSAMFAFLWVVVAAVVGVTLVRWQHVRTWSKVRQELDAGRVPAASLFDGALIVTAGVLLIIPGVLTDLCAVALLLPPVRRLIRHYVRRRLVARFGGAVGSQPWSAGIGRHDEVIEGHLVEPPPANRDDDPSEPHGSDRP